MFIFFIKTINKYFAFISNIKKLTNLFLLFLFGYIYCKTKIKQNFTLQCHPCMVPLSVTIYDNLTIQGKYFLNDLSCWVE